MTIKMKNENNARIRCSTSAFEAIPTITEEAVKENKRFLFIQNEDKG